jgi:hypothetical protein
MFQPSDVAQSLGLKGFGCRIDETMQFLSPGVYGFVDFFLLSPDVASNMARSSKRAISLIKA